MLYNMFELFNPMSSKTLSLNWLSLVPSMLILWINVWVSSSQAEMMFKTSIMKIPPQLKSSINKKSMSTIIIFTSIMIMIMMINLMGLFPYVFTNTSHISFNFSLVLPMWISFLLMKLKTPMKLMSHFIPLGTPLYLISFMSMIEMISFIIQPITLTIRLTANIMAGHILLAIISEPMILSMMFLPMMIPQIMFSMLEICVGMIQAYVLSTLLIMFMK